MPALVSLTVLTGEAAAAKQAFADLDAVAAGVHMARDLVNEPANHLFPIEFAGSRQDVGARSACKSRS